MTDNLLTTLTTGFKSFPSKVVMGCDSDDTRPYMFLLTEKGRFTFNALRNYTLNHKNGIKQRKMHMFLYNFTQMKLNGDAELSSEYTYFEYTPL